ncbi:MAG TPA: LacI family DNA-binding transcriptional regulator [Tepidisphaeraceae bacterium]|nr:LacI family DNA-binding transcriptional regulator [Tepidisphaeraceae bacterium]
MSINTVAKLAGVSTSTVSRVINNHPRVAPETERNVRKAMQELGYAPSDRRPGPKSAARQKTINKSAAILMFGSSGQQVTPGFAGLLRGVSRGAAENSIDLSFHFIRDRDELPSRILDQRTDGLLLHGSRPGQEVERWLRKMPTVWLMGNRRRPDWGDQVMPDSYEIGHLAAQYLVERGHRNLAFMNMDSGFWPFRLYNQSFCAAAADLGVSVSIVEQAFEPGADYWQRYNPRLVSKVVDQFMALSPRPTGLFIADDMQVAVIQPALQARRVKLGPGETQIISCNNEAPFRVGLTPQPAAIDIRVESIGHRGIEQLLWRLAHPHVVERLVSAIEPFVVDAEANENAQKI